MACAPGWQARQVVVLGLMGAGKSTLSAALSERLSRPLRDSDLDLWAGYRITAHDLAAQQSVAALHAVEARLLLTALQGRPAVIAAAASTVEVPAARASLRPAVPQLSRTTAGATLRPGMPVRPGGGPLVVWLDGPDDVLAGRYASGPHRPDLGIIRAVLARQRRSRGPVMRSLARVAVDATMATSNQVDLVVSAWRAGA